MPRSRPPIELRPATALKTWQRNRCAICGITGTDPLVEDHCHHTGLVRGWLCHSCNTREGIAVTEPFIAYRFNPPATIIGLTEIYSSIWSGVIPASSQQLPYHRKVPTDPREAARFLRIETFRAAYWRFKDADCLAHLSALCGTDAATRLEQLRQRYRFRTFTGRGAHPEFAIP